MRASSALVLSTLFLAIAPACGSSPCVSGAQVQCACPDGSKGAQACKADGSGFGACLCASSTTSTSATTTTTSSTSTGTGGNGGNGGAGGSGGGTGGHTTSSTTGTGGSGGTFCVPGEQKACYSGPANTAGVGLCVAGLTTCKPDGSAFGACVGEITPQPETCATPGDDDCNGMANEGGAGCACAPNTQSACYSGPPATQGVGPCHGGMQLCKPDGTGYGSCVGEVTPAPETCNTPIDDDCDGMINEEGLGCACAPGATTACYDGPMGTQNVGLCKAGTHLCNDQGTAYGPCVGQVLPSMDLCATPADEDCNGQAMPCVGGQAWSKRFGGLNSQESRTLAVDAMGNVLIGGRFQGSVDFGGGVLASAGGSGDAWVAKFDALGNHLWSKKFGDASQQEAHGVAFDPGGNALVVGYLAGTADFGGGTVFSAGNNDAFVAKLAPGGGHLWSKTFGDIANQTAWGVATDASSNVIVTGVCGGAIDFGAGPVAGNGPVFVAKLDAAGSALWAKRFGDPNLQQVAYTVKTDGLENIIIVGDFSGSIDFGGGALVSAGGSQDIFVAKFGAGGNHLWSKRFGDAYDQHAYGLGVDAAGNLVLTGGFVGTLDFGGVPLVGSTMANTDNIFVAKLGSSGQHLWSKQFGDSLQQFGYAAATGPGGTVLVTGFAAGTVDFGGGSLLSAGGRDVFLARFDSSGNHLSSKLFGDAGDQYGTALAADDAGGAYLTGYFSSGLDFGTGLLTSAGGDDIFLARLAP